MTAIATACLLAIVLILPAAGQAGTPRVCVVVSRDIRPFVLMADALESSLDAAVTRVYLDSAYRPSGESGKHLEIEEADYDLFVAVGPRALSHLMDKGITTRIFYGMVLNPESLVTEGDHHVSGVSLNIFSLIQLHLIRQVLPDIRRIGVIHDPAHNANWFNSARLLASTRKIELIPLTVSDRSRIPAVLEDAATRVDAVLFIPDVTVISSTIIQHAIKQLILKKIPVIGYNRFFAESGAAMSFVVDSETVGRQVASMARAFLKEGRVISGGGPVFRITLNARVLSLLGLRVNDDLPENTEFLE